MTAKNFALKDTSSKMHDAIMAPIITSPSFRLGPALATLTRDPLRGTSAWKWTTHSEYIGCFGRSWAVWLGFDFQTSLWLIHFLLRTKAMQTRGLHAAFPFWLLPSGAAAANRPPPSKTSTYSLRATKHQVLSHCIHKSQKHLTRLLLCWPRPWSCPCCSIWNRSAL